MRVKICILTTVHQPFDTRIFHKEAKTLVQAGYDVTLIAQHRKNEIVDGVNIVALPKPRNRFTRIFGLTWQTLFLAIHQRANIYHFHDPELIFMGILLKLFGKKVIYDVHEDVPKQILNKEWIGNKSIRTFVSFLMNILERFNTIFSTKIIAATDDIAKKFPFNKTITLRNLPVLKIIDSVSVFNQDKTLPIIIYAGGLTRIRGIKEIIQSMEYVNEKAELWLLGNWQSKQYREECEKLQGWNKTKYLGFKPLEEVYSLVKSADIAITNFLPVNNHLKSNPNKIYEYMACSVPVIMSDFPYWKEVFGDFALFANPYDPESIAQQISILLKDKEKAQELGKKGRELVESQYNWETESKKLIILYELILCL